ncbi:hypothetical protein D0Y65_006260 [Glycine soja]|uniref:Uncharacterized protein n=1 Tax=Glycine soja TaxID=3848 RepID=A0A445L7Z0_GLYSO|nr:hypothetical protein D0Y65_006260 [Glycine soja]
MQFGVEKLVRSNYKYWRLCMEAFLQVQDLWDLMAKNDMKMPPDTPDTMEARRKWKVKYGKMLFVLRMTVNKELIDHIRDLDTPKDVWETLEKLFSKKNVARLQLLENELASTVQVLYLALDILALGSFVLALEYETSPTTNDSIFEVA